MKKILKLILSTFLIMIILCDCFNIYSFATQEMTAYYKEDCGKLLKKDGVILKVSYVVINNNGIESPIYCLDKNKPGAETSSYNISINSVIKDVKIWRAIKNGYPYKTPEQMNCANYKEAFTATKMAVYSNIYGYTIDNFEPIGEAGERTWNALREILESVNNSTDRPLSSNINIIEDTESWKQDENNKNYIYKLMSVNSEGKINKYNIFLGDNYPEGIKITDKNDNYRESFSNGEQFKIVIPIKELKDEGIINLKVTGELKNNPIYLGESSDKNNQDYAVTQINFEKGTGEKNIKYSDNKTTIKIIKKDENNNNLGNAIFELLDENKNVIQTNLSTDVNGEIEIKDINPGKYYIQEIKAPEGYKNYNQLIEVNVKFNEVLSAIIKNSKEEEPTIEIDRNTIEIKSVEPKIKLPKTGM